MTGRPLCALCLAQPAELYCKNDDANLCTACDITYHSSNPLANRHERIPLPQCLNESCSSAVLPASSLAESDADLAVVPEYTRSGDLPFGDTMFGANGLAGTSFNSGLNTGDLFDLSSGGGLFGFDLNDLLDFSNPADDGSDCLVQHGQTVMSEDNSMFDALVPSLNASVPQAKESKLAFSSGGPIINGVPDSFFSSKAPFSLPQATLLPYSQETMLHMVPQLQPSASQAFSPLIPVPSGAAAPPVAAKPASNNSAHQQQVEQAAIKQGGLAENGAPAPTEVPLTRAERVARYLEKKKRRNFKKVIRYQSRKAYAEVRPRIKGRFATPAEVAAMKAEAAAKLAAAAEMDDVAVVPAC